eukprot:m.23284 g.23284  ORF g.23284 m.23284 type:complete len:339 (-) comp5924_c0_seq1:38-1054(-)
MVTLSEGVGLSLTAAVVGSILRGRPPRRLTVHFLLSVLIQYLWERILLWCPNASETCAAPTVLSVVLLSMGLWQTTLWATVLLCAWLDRQLARKAHLPWWVVGKLQQQHPQPEPPFWAELLPRCLANQAIAAVAVLGGFWYIASAHPRWFTLPKTSLSGADDGDVAWQFQVVSVANFWLRWAGTISQTFALFATSDVLFWTGHYLMHTSRTLKRHHALHHSSWAGEALSGYYMSPVDFVLEHFPLFVAWAAWQNVGPAWPVSICTGAYNLLVTHSGWDLRFGPDPRDHFFHHNGGAEGSQSNFGIFLDRPMGTLVNKQFDGAFAHVPGSVGGTGRPAE